MTQKTKTWLKAAGVRAIKTFCQAAISAIGTTVVMQEVNWLMIASIAGLSAILSILTSGAGLPEAPINIINKDVIL